MYYAISDRIDSLFVAPPVSDDKIFGALEDDNFLINGGHNFVFTGAGDDLINLTRSQGNNRIYSGSGNDLIQLSTEARDVIADFKLGSDTLAIASVSFTDLTIK